MSRFPDHFYGQFGTSLRALHVQGQKSIISFNLHYEFDGRSKAVEVVKTLLQSCWPMWQNHESVDVSEPFSRFVVCLGLGNSAAHTNTMSKLDTVC
jgi:hypothetical protein